MFLCSLKSAGAFLSESILNFNKKSAVFSVVVVGGIHKSGAGSEESTVSTSLQDSLSYS